MPGLVNAYRFGAPGGGSMPEALYWRIVVLGVATLGSTWPAVAEIEMAETPGGPNLCSGGTVFGDAASILNPRANAFDGDNATYAAHSSLGQKVFGYQFASPVSINEIRLRAAPIGSSAAIAAQIAGFLPQYSDDGVNWISGEPCGPSIDWMGGEQRAFPITPIVARTRSTARLWRLSAWSGGNIAELLWRATSGGAQLAMNGCWMGSGEVNGGVSVGHIFDGNSASRWLGGGGSWFSYFFPTAPDPQYLAIQAPGYPNGNAISAFDADVEWSQDGLTWTKIADLTDGDGIAARATQEYAL